MLFEGGQSRSVTYDTVPRYIRNGRDLAEYVHYDFAYQASLGAALILINSNAKSVRISGELRELIFRMVAENATWVHRVFTEN